MSSPENNPPANRKCPQCGAELPNNVPPELCPKCLLKAAMGAQPPIGPSGTVALPQSGLRSRGLPQPGERLGHYAITRLLGAGGMGAVFEAEDLENGRRVALKVLSQALDSPEARERFFREGRLAASLNHPNSVYVFGTEEIGGTPVIAMELVAGGTLEERVRAHGPMPSAEAVDAVLQIIAGLEAAQQVGILHRDIKPSNCFRDLNGAVKVGDFGLSISTTVRTEPALTATGAFLGTPAFCSPEQLRGEELNARSDMYSVGATLFYLLTGRTPFESKNAVALIATVLEQRAPTPRKFRANIPQGLAKVILRCLEKQPGERFKNYSELAQALAPYGSAAPTPATLGLRFVAGALDMIVQSGFGMIVMGLVLGGVMDWNYVSGGRSAKALALMFSTMGVMVFYFALLEGIWGVTAGKAICRLRVVGRDNSPPGFWRALPRAMIYVLLPALPYWVMFGADPKAYMSSPQGVQPLIGFSHFILIALLFCTARRRNGFAALHDLLTTTRVISRVALQSRPVLAFSETLPPAVESKVTVGPYHVLETLEKFASVEWLLGYDLRLLRKVWIRVVEPETAPVAASLRNIGRVGRLRWLTGLRSPEENWDAFEAATGKPLVSLLQTPQPWSQVRFWLYDLANEISGAAKDGTLPSVLALDRVWITADGRAKLLDFPAPGITSRQSIAEESPQRFLGEVATAALTGGANATARTASEVSLRLPLHARNFLKNLPQLPDADAVAHALKPLLQRLAEISQLRRAAIVAGCLALPLLATAGVFFGMTILEQWNAHNPGVMELSMLLQHRAGVNSRWAKGRPHPTDQQFAVYIAHHYGSIITNDARWTDMFALALIKSDQRRFAEQSVAEHPAPTEKEIVDAEAALKSHRPSTDTLSFLKKPWFPPMILGVTLVTYVGIPALVAALLFRGGLILLVAGVTFVRRDGARASRLRVFWRSLVAWSPLLVTPFVFGLLMRPLGGLAAGVIPALLVCGLLIISMVLPNRGLADRLAGTWPVPR